MSTTTVNFGWILPTPGGDAQIWGTPTLGLNKTITDQDTLVRALYNTSIANTAPTVAQSGTMWINNTVNPWVWSVYNLPSTTWIPIGTIDIVTNTFTPANGSAGSTVGDLKVSAQSANHGVWLLCDGSAVSRATYSGLNSLMASLSYPYGAGDGVTTFNVPDMRGKVPGGIGLGTYTGATTHALGSFLGQELHTLTIPEMPVHQHFIQGIAGFFPGATGGIIGGAPATNGSTNAPSFNDAGTSLTGGTAYVTQGHNNIQPTLFAGNYFISIGG
jgi:microcystin-dependent protein